MMSPPGTMIQRDLGNSLMIKTAADKSQVFFTLISLQVLFILKYISYFSKI